MKPHLTVLALATSLATTVILPAQEVLKNQGTDWDYLLHRNLATPPLPVDPGGFDPDFYTTWQDPDALGYNGPAFQTGTGYFGYGTIDGVGVITNTNDTTNIWDPTLIPAVTGTAPPSGMRYSAYFRTTITPTAPVTALRFTGIIDDGAIIYIDGAEVARTANLEGVPFAPQQWQTLTTVGGSETVPVVLSFPIALAVGEHTVAVSVHNTSATSSDLGFDVMIESTVPTTPANDDFVDASELTGPLPITALGATDDSVGGIGATKEAGEPNHAGDTGGGSVWWKWTPTETGRVSVSTNGSSISTLLGVYTGFAVNAITPVSRYANLNVPATSAEEPFHFASRVEFEAESGTTYYIVVDGAGGAFGDVTFTIDNFFSSLDPVAELLPAGSNWEYLLAVDGTNQPIDPATLDPDGDFDTTWHTSVLYNGPAFSGPAPALLGYGLLNADPVVTDIWGGLDHNGDLVADLEPPTGLRYATYLRTTFTPTASVQHLGFEGLIDDGAIIYINGVEVTRINFGAAKDADDWTTFADGANVGTPAVSTENAPQVGYALDINLPASQLVELGVSLRSANATSSDMGFDLRVYSTNLPIEPPAPENFNLVVAKGLFPGEYEISWSSVFGATYRLEFSETLEEVDWDLNYLTGIPADPSGTTTIIDVPLPAQGFYRVVQE